MIYKYFPRIESVEAIEWNGKLTDSVRLWLTDSNIHKIDISQESTIMESYSGDRFVVYVGDYIVKHVGKYDKLEILDPQDFVKLYVPILDELNYTGFGTK
jgi:hypothetical protein